MEKALLYLLFFLCFSGNGLAQTYWQQEVNYAIQVTLDDQQHTLTATAKIEYINHSPDELTFIYFHLWPNAYRNTQTAFARQQLVNNSLAFQFANEQARGYIDGLDFKVDGEPVRLEYDPQHIDIARLILNQPLRSGDRIRISTPFQVKIPESFSRLGHEGQSYQITQWYPKPAVYDRKGWHPLPYLDQGEFYAEFGRFDVSITLPANYTVGATGVLQNPEEQARMDSLATITARKTVFEPDMDFPPSSSQTKTLHYVQDRVHDFAWFADKRYNIFKSEVKLPASRRPVTTWLLFLNQGADEWKRSVKHINDAIYYYSLWVGDYPYQQATAVDGALVAGSGMEYPMVTVTEPEALVHEIGHNWFYGVLASQERLHPWMDEGINTYVENRIAKREDPNAGDLSSLLNSPRLVRLFGLKNLNANALNQLPYQMSASRGLDQPVELPAPAFRSVNYGLIVYYQTAHLFQYLAAYLGQERFDGCMHAYYDQWKFRHPYPEDLQAVFEQRSGERLDWFFKGLLQTINPLDIMPASVSATPTGYEVTVRNRSNAPVPVPVGAFDAEGRLLEIRWIPSFSGTATLSFSGSTIHHFLVDPEYLLPEINRSNNLIRTRGLLPKAHPLRLQFLAGIEQPARKQLYFFPVLGWNTLERFMPGIAFYNNLLIQKKLNVLVLPMYSFGQRQLNGIFTATYHLYRGHAGQFSVEADARQFERFSRLSPALTFTPRLRLGTSPRQRFRLAYTRITEEPTSEYPYRIHAAAYNVQSASYRLDVKNALRTLTFGLELHRFGYAPLLSGDQSAHLARADISFSRFYKPNKKVQARLFGGSFFGASQGDPGYFRIGLSSSFDYLKEEIFLDRSRLSPSVQAFVHQTDERDGGFRNYVPVSSRDWLATLNLTADLPVSPFSVYLDLGTLGGEDQVFYGTGFGLSLAKNVFNVYLPVAGSNYANSFPDSFWDFRKNIRFSLHLHALDPFRLLRASL